MREATLGPLSALDTVRPRQGTGRAPSSGKGRRAGTRGPRFRKMRAHLALIVGSAGFSAIMIGIVLNATVMQKEHHPAPLFGTVPAPVHAAAPTAAPAHPVPPPVESAAAVPLVPPPAVVPAPGAPRPAAMAKPLLARPVHAHPVVAPAAKVDGIARLLGPSAPRPVTRPSSEKPRHTAPVAGSGASPHGSATPN